jgi:pilus assembly protein CpaB
MQETKRRGTIFTTVAIVLAFITAFLLFSYLNRYERELGDKINVVVAAQDIPAKTVVTEDMVKVDALPMKYVRDSYIRHVIDAVGQITLIGIGEGDILQSNQLIRGLDFDADKTAVTIGVDEVTGVGGLVSPGDYVNVLVSFVNEETKVKKTFVLLQNKRVLAVGTTSTELGIGPLEELLPEGGGQVRGGTVTLALSVDEATQLTYASNFAQEVRLTLRRRDSVPLPEIPAVTSTDFK